VIKLDTYQSTAMLDMGFFNIIKIHLPKLLMFTPPFAELELSIHHSHYQEAKENLPFS
jgi:hypothetical protein